MKKLITTLVVMIFLYGNGFSQFNKSGRTSMQFLKIGIGARQVGIGEANIAGVQDINSIFWNPAEITGINNSEASFTYTQWIGDLKIFSGAVGYTFPNIGTLAVNYISLDYGQIPEALTTSTSGKLDTRTGNTFGGGDLAFGLGFAKEFTDKLSIGINARYVRENLFIYSSHLWSFDIGSFYNTGWKGIKIGMSAQNFSTPARWLYDKEEAQQTYDLPLVFRIGLSVDMFGGQELFFGGDPDVQKLTFNIDAIHSNDYGERLHMGLEYILLNIFTLRGGYKLNYEEGNLSLGVGVKYDVGPLNLRFDYSYVNYDFLQSPNRFTISMEF